MLGCLALALGGKISSILGNTCIFDRVLSVAYIPDCASLPSPFGHVDIQLQDQVRAQKNNETRVYIQICMHRSGARGDSDAWKV